MVMRPKSSATVVVVFRSTPERSSTPTDAAVITSSVRSGATSLTEPTMVVLPTPKPPAMMILTALAVKIRRGSEFPDAIKDRLKYVFVGDFGHRRRRAEEHMTLLDEITEQDLHHRKWQVDPCRDLGNRRGVLTQAPNPPGFRLPPHRPG